jgi:hypothetical protein
MTEPRLASNVAVSALLRKTNMTGGNAAIVARGDAIAGVILLLLIDRGRLIGLRERTWRLEGHYTIEPTGPDADKGEAAANEYIERRRHSDPDLWVVEIDHPDAEALAMSLC